MIPGLPQPRPCSISHRDRPCKRGEARSTCHFFLCSVQVCHILCREKRRLRSHLGRGLWFSIYTSPPQPAPPRGFLRWVELSSFTKGRGLFFFFLKGNISIPPPDLIPLPLRVLKPPGPCGLNPHPSPHVSGPPNLNLGSPFPLCLQYLGLSLSFNRAQLCIK